MRDSVPGGSYSSVCNVLSQWSISLIPTYRVYLLYDNIAKILAIERTRKLALLAIIASEASFLVCSMARIFAIYNWGEP